MKPISALARRGRSSVAVLALLWITAACSAAAAPATGPAPSSPSSRTASAEACFPTNGLAADDRALADSLLAAALDNEGLYTLVGGMKPMSSVTQLRLRTARPDSVPAGSRAATDSASAELERMRRHQRVANALSCGSIRMVVVPYRMSDGAIRNVQVSVVDGALLDRVIARDQAFWGQWGFVPGTDPAVLVTATEYGASADRFRGYGYLFGYPEHAVSFFVRAAVEEDSTGEFVKREFFQIPAFSGERGRFVYAVPEGYVPGEVDTALRARAGEILQAYRLRRARHVNPDGTLRAAELLRVWYAEGGVP